MSNRSLLIVCIVLLSIIAITLIAFLVLALTGKYRGFGIGNFSRYDENNIIFDESYEEELVNSFELKSEAGDISIEPSQDKNIKVIVYGKNEDNVIISFNEGNLKIDVKQQRRVFNFGMQISDIKVLIPQSYSKKLNVEANYGDIEIGNFENAIMSVKEDCGNIKIASVKNATVENHYGDIKIDTITNKCNISNNCGSIKIHNLDIKEDSSIESDLGDIKVEKTSDIFVDAKVDLGDIKINQNNRHSEITLKCKNSCGDIKVNY